MELEEPFQGLEYGHKKQASSKRKTGLTRLRKTERRPRSTFKGGSQRLKNEIPLEEVKPDES